MTSRAKPGRKKLDPDTMTRGMTIKLSDALRAQIDIAARRADQSIGEWLREAAELRLERDADEIKAR